MPSALYKAMAKRSTVYPQNYLDQFKETDFAWLAGIIEGDGSISYTKGGKDKQITYLHISFNNTDTDLINRVAHMMDANPYEKDQSHSVMSKLYPTKRMWRVEVSGHKAEILYQRLMLYIVSKKAIPAFERKCMLLPRAN